MSIRAASRKYKDKSKQYYFHTSVYNNPIIIIVCSNNGVDRYKLLNTRKPRKDVNYATDKTS